MSIGFGGGSSSKSESGTKEPWAPQQPYLLRGFEEAGKLLSANGGGSSTPTPQPNYGYGGSQTGFMDPLGGGWIDSTAYEPVAAAASGSGNPYARSYYSGTTVPDFSDATKAGMASVTSMAGDNKGYDSALSQLTGTAGGQYLQTPEQWAARTQNPNLNVKSQVFSNPNINAKSQVGLNPFMVQGGNEYIDDVSQSIGRSVIPQVKGSYAGSGRTGSSPMAQQAMAKGIADSLAPYAFGSAEAELGRRFTGGENLATRFQDSSENQANRQFTGSENYATRAQDSSENQANRQFAGSESALTRGMAAYDAERNRQMNAATAMPELDLMKWSGIDRLFGVGKMQEDQQAAKLAEEKARYDYNRDVPGDNLQKYMDLVNGTYGSVFNSVGKGDSKNFGLSGGN